MGVLCLGLALGMVLADRWVLAGHRDPFVHLTYWFVCLLFTLAAMLIAVADMLAVRQDSRDRRRELVEDAIREIEAKRKEEETQE
jgi:hypothetical protein